MTVDAFWIVFGIIVAYLIGSVLGPVVDARKEK